MVRSLFLACLKAYLGEEKQTYDKGWGNFFLLIGLIILLTANYIYFFTPDQEIAPFLVIATFLIIIVCAIQCYDYFLKKTVKNNALSKLETGTNEFINIIAKQFNELVSIKTIASFLPIIIRFLPIGVITLVIFYIVKRKISNTLYRLPRLLK